MQNELTTADILRDKRRQLARDAETYDKAAESYAGMERDARQCAKDARRIHGELAVAIVALEGPEAPLDLPEGMFINPLGTRLPPSTNQ